MRASTLFICVTLLCLSVHATSSRFKIQQQLQHQAPVTPLPASPKQQAIRDYNQYNQNTHQFQTPIYIEHLPPSFDQIEGVDQQEQASSSQLGNDYRFNQAASNLESTAAAASTSQVTVDQELQHRIQAWQQFMQAQAQVQKQQEAQTLSQTQAQAQVVAQTQAQAQAQHLTQQAREIPYYPYYSMPNAYYPATSTSYGFPWFAQSEYGPLDGYPEYFNNAYQVMPPVPFAYGPLTYPHPFPPLATELPPFDAFEGMPAPPVLKDSSSASSSSASASASASSGSK